MFNGNCEEALNFYAKALGGEIIHLSRYEGSPLEAGKADNNKVMHATLKAGGVMIMAADETGPGAHAVDGGSVHLTLDFDSIEQEEKVFNALSQGGKIVMELQDTFWGARFGMLTDKFGIHWMFNQEIAKG